LLSWHQCGRTGIFNFLWFLSDQPSSS